VLRLFLALNLLLLNLYACKGGYESCKLKLKDSNSLTCSTINLPVKKHQRLLFSTSKPTAKILKHDPYLSLYLIEDTKGFKYPFVINHNLVLGTAVVNEKRAIEGKILKHQIGLNHFATFSEAVDFPSVMLTSCCSLEGLVTPRGIIEKEYLERFIKIKKVSYGDIGIRVKDDGGYVLVNSVNHFMRGNPFMLDDCILTFDGKKVRDAATLMRWILFSKIGSIHTLKIKRGSKYLTLKMKTQKRYGGGYLDDTYLKFLGLHFDKNLNIVRIEPKAYKYELKIGDRLISINQKNVPSESEIVKMLLENKKVSNLLFTREHFQFFVKIKSI
jgi:hypothetical protein